ncbi:hypothetical protein AB5N19_00021 [Seiridium cardinale]
MPRYRDRTRAARKTTQRQAQSLPSVNGKTPRHRLGTWIDDPSPEFIQSNGNIDESDNQSDEDYNISGAFQAIDLVDDTSSEEDLADDSDESQVSGNIQSKNFCPVNNQIRQFEDAIMQDANRGARGMGRQSDEIGGNPFDFLNIDLDSELHDGNLHPPEFYQKGIKELDEYNYDRKEYAPGTNKIMHAVSKKWQLILQKDPKSVLRKINFNVTFFFLNWCLNQKTGKGGRRKKGIATKSSLTTFWCNFRLVFERETRSKIDGRVDRGRIGNALVRLGEKYKLTHEKRENRSMTLTDLKHQIATTLRTTDKSFKLGEMRILAILFLSLLAPAESRPTSILKLRFGDSRVLLARDPDGGPHRLVIKFTLSFTKQYLGKKASKTFLIPEIIYDPSLLLSPHVFLLGILFKNHLNIINGENVLRLPLKDDLKDVLVFRRAGKDVYGFTTSRSVGITSAMMTTWLRRIGELAGFEHNTMSYSLRYNAGNNMDQNGTSEVASLFTGASEARLKVRSTKATLFKALKDHVRQEWTEKQALEDIEPAITGENPLTGGQTRNLRPMSIPQPMLVAALEQPPIVEIHAQFQRRTAAIDAIVAYCGAEEPVMTKVLEAIIPPPPPELQHHDPAEELRQSVFVGTGQARLLRCFICIGKALNLPYGDPNIPSLCRQISDAQEVTKHLRRHT